MVKTFIVDIKSEFIKMKVPARKEVFQSSGVLLVFVFIAAILLSLLDYLSSLILLLF